LYKAYDSGAHALPWSLALLVFVICSLSIASTAEGSTVRDEFNAVSYGGNDGSRSWSNDWQEIGESNGANSGRVRVSGNSLRIEGAATGGTNYGLRREADLSSATVATLTFDYRVDDDAGGGGTTRIQVSDNGGSTWTTLQTYNLSNGAPWTSQSFDISAYRASDTQLRFFGAPDNNNVYFYADDVQIEYYTVVNSTGDAVDLVAGDGECDTGGVNSEGNTECTLRAAIQEFNALPGANNIEFDIPDTELGYSGAPLSYTIQPGSPLPSITGTLVMDGSTQPDFTTTPIIVLDGASAGAGARGLVLDGSGSSTIRGLVINNFELQGIRVDSNNNTIVGNWLGLGADGVSGAANSVGIRISGNNNTVGGTLAADRNVVSGNNEIGITIFGRSNLIIGNYIGTDSSGAVAGIGNGWDGIRLAPGDEDNTIGGTTVPSRNIIADNNRVGIATHGSAGVANRFLGNSIYANATLGIDLAFDGVTSNDAGDPDAGPNDLLNFPALNSATVVGANVTVNYDLDVELSGDYRIEFFTNPSGTDPTNYGEGEVFVSSINIAHAGAGSQNYNHSFPGAVGDAITATTTMCTDGACSAFLKTSEFSQFETAVPSVNLSLVKRAFWPDGTPIPTGATIPNGVEFKYLLYINNQVTPAADVSVRDALDAAFQYQPGTIQVDNSVVECALLACTAVEELAIFTAVDGAPFLTDALADDVVSYTAPNVDAGDGNAGNLQLDINADAVWAIMFSVKMP